MNEDIKETKKDVPYIVFEGELARAERHIKRLWIALIVAVVALLACNIAWLYYESQFETIAYSQDGAGLNIIGDSNEVPNYGAEGQDKTAEVGEE